MFSPGGKSITWIYMDRMIDCEIVIDKKNFYVAPTLSFVVVFSVEKVKNCGGVSYIKYKMRH